MRHGQGKSEAADRQNGRVSDKKPTAAPLPLLSSATEAEADRPTGRPTRARGFSV